MALGHKRATIIATFSNGNKIVLFLFPRSSVEAKHGVEFRYSTRNAFRTRRKNGERNVLTLSSLCLPCCVRDTA